LVSKGVRWSTAKGKPQLESEVMLVSLESSRFRVKGKGPAAPGYRCISPQNRGGFAATVLQRAVGKQLLLQGQESGLEIVEAVHHVLPLRPILRNEGTTRYLQAKLRVNTPADQDKQDADYIAENAVRISPPGHTSGTSLRDSLTP
jgi:hypothetical protein